MGNAPANAGKTCGVPFSFHWLVFHCLDSVLNLSSRWAFLTVSASTDLASITWDHIRDPQTCLSQWGPSSQVLQGEATRTGIRSLCLQNMIKATLLSQSPSQWGLERVARCGERAQTKSRAGGVICSKGSRAGGLEPLSAPQPCPTSTSTKTWQLTAVSPTSSFLLASLSLSKFFKAGQCSLLQSTKQAHQVLCQGDVFLTLSKGRLI